MHSFRELHCSRRLRCTFSVINIISLKCTLVSQCTNASVILYFFLSDLGSPAHAQNPDNDEDQAEDQEDFHLEDFPDRSRMDARHLY